MGRSKHESISIKSLNPPLAGYKLWFICCIIRAVNSIIIRTYFEPDEYWQSLEVAHHYIFGYGWLTWEWREGIRSVIYLLPFAFYYKILSLFKLDGYDILIIYGPRIIQSFFAGSVDYFIYILSYRVYQCSKVAEASISLSLINWFNMAYSTRTFSNNLESFLILFGYLQLFSKSDRKIFQMIKIFIIMGISILIRPSAITFWFYPLINLFSRHGFGIKIQAFVSVIIGVITTILLGLLFDSIFYEKFVLTWLNFAKFNVFMNISEFYGQNPWYFHFVQSLPAIIGTMFPLLILTLLHKEADFHLLLFIASGIFLNSILPHKEIRFIAPLVPFLIILIGRGFVLFSCSDSFKIPKLLKRIYLQVLLLTNVFFGIYLCRFHQRGVVNVMDWLRKETDAGHVKHVLFAMPCHAIPFYSYLHRNISMKFVTCEPPLYISHELRKTYKDESDIFNDNPSVFLESWLRKETISSHIILFSYLTDRIQIQNVLNNHNFQECNRFHNSQFNPDTKRKGDVVVYCKDKTF